MIDIFLTFKTLGMSGMTESMDVGREWSDAPSMSTLSAKRTLEGWLFSLKLFSIQTNTVFDATS